MRRFDLRADGGQVGGIEVIPFGMLTFVVGMLLATSGWAVVDAKLATDAAAREAARAFVEADPPDLRSARRAAAEAAHDTFVAQGRDPARASVMVVGLEGPGGVATTYTRCARVVIEVSYRVPMISVPLVGGYGTSVTATSRHSEIVDPYRSGVPGDAQC
jgi:hypothetical protein